MTYVVTKIIKGNPYLYEVKSVREGDRVRQVFVRYLGRGEGGTGERKERIRRPAVAVASEAVAPTEVKPEIPAPKPASEVVPVTPEVTKQFPPYVDNYRKPLTTYTDTLYHETDIEGLYGLMPQTTGHWQGDTYFANTPELALGQGTSKGVHIKFSAEGIEGQLNQKPVWAMLYKQNQAEFIDKHPQENILKENIKEITIDANITAGSRGQRIAVDRWLSSWDKTVNPDGSITYKPKPLPKAKPSMPEVTKEVVTPTAPTPEVMELESARNEIQGELEYAQKRVLELRQALKEKGGTREKRIWNNNELARNNTLVAEYGRLLRENNPEELVRYIPKPVTPTTPAVEPALPVEPEMGNLTLKQNITKAVEERPTRISHGYTAKNAFYVTKDSRIIPADEFSQVSRGDDIISVHSHSGENWEQYTREHGQESFQPPNAADFDHLRWLVKQGYGNKIAVIMGDGRYIQVEIPEPAQPRFTRMGRKTLEKLLYPESRGVSDAEHIAKLKAVSQEEGWLLTEGDWKA